MFINLNNINEAGTQIDQYIEFEESYYKDTIIKGLKDVYVKGKVYYSTTREIIFEGTISGIMQIVDSLSGEIVDYNFNSDVNEILGESSEYDEVLRTNQQERLDLKEVLWQNIVLEVPITFSVKSDAKITKGEGWELRNENSVKEDPRLDAFRALLKDEGKE